MFFAENFGYLLTAAGFALDRDDAGGLAAMVLAGLLGRPCAKAYWLSWSLPADWLEVPAEPVSSPQIATPSCLAGGGAAAPAESYVSRAAHPI